MFLLGLIYLIILIVWAIFGVSWTERRGTLGGIAQLVLFAIIGFVLFWGVLNK